MTSLRALPIRDRHLLSIELSDEAVIPEGPVRLDALAQSGGREAGIAADFADEVGLIDLQLLASHGFSEDDIWDISAITAFFGLSNRLANVTNMRPNPEFYSLGR